MPKKRSSNKTYILACRSCIESPATRKIFIATVVFIVSVFVIFYFIGKKSRRENDLVLILDYGFDKKTYSFKTLKEDRAWNLLQQVAALKNINLVPTNDFRPQEINGMVDGANNKHWSFYLNGEKQQKSPYKMLVKSPAKVAFRYE